MGVVRLCPQCGQRVGLDDQFCGSCGAPLPRDVLHVKKEATDRPSVGWRIASWVLELFPGLTRPVVLIMSIVALVVAAGVGGLALYIFLLGAVITGFFIGGFAVVIYWTALSWLMFGDVVMPAEALSEFQGKHWWALMLFTLVPLAAMFHYAKSQVGG